jgi:ribosome-binding factor A
MPRFRKDRVAELIRQAISDIVVLKIKDPRVKGVTITEISMSADLKSARVFFGSLADGKPEAHQEGLTSAEGFIRRELRKELDLRYIPALTFEYDTSFDHSIRIHTILKKIQVSQPENDE